MGANTVRCHVLGDEVTVVTDFAGQAVNVICPAFSRPTYNCKKKLEGTGMVAVFFKRLLDRQAGSKAIVCEFIDAAGSLSARLAEK